MEGAPELLREQKREMKKLKFIFQKWTGINYSFNRNKFKNINICLKGILVKLSKSTNASSKLEKENFKF